MLKLFRDYLFHTVTESGQPWLDHAHIIQCLNKLDSGTMEKVNERHNIYMLIARDYMRIGVSRNFTNFLIQVQLMSRDEQSILIVTYAELKHCLEQAFSDITAAT